MLSGINVAEWQSLVGGLFLGAAVALNRRVSNMQTGVGSALKGAVLQPFEPDSALKMAFVAGICVAGGLLLDRQDSHKGLQRPKLSGALVGFGVSMANGCTAGHGISGLSAGSSRSAAAVGSFMAAGILTARQQREEAHGDGLGFDVAPAAVVVAFVFAILLARGHPAATGMLFGTGLVVSGMVNNNHVRNFLRDPLSRPARLPATMAAAVFSAFAFGPEHSRLSSRAQGGGGGAPIDWRLLVGSAIFGIGWGLSGVCPGPSLVLTGGGSASAASYVAALLTGMQVELWSRRIRAAPLLQSGPFECHLVYDAPTGSCTYLIVDTRSASVVVIDPVASDRLFYPSARLPGGFLLDEAFGSDLPKAVTAAVSALASEAAEVPLVINTHVHADRLTGSGALRGLKNTRSVLSAAYSDGNADVRPKDGDVLRAGALELRFLATPGHTEGCMSVYVPQLGCVFTGDALLIGGFGRTDMQGGSSEALLASGRRLLTDLPGETAVLPAHEYADPNRAPQTLAQQAQTNPLLTAKSTQELQEAQRAEPEAMSQLVDANMACGIVPDPDLLNALRTVRQSSSVCG